MICYIWNIYFLQLEKSPTLGSIETTDHEKRCLAEQSLKFNLGDKIFNELFPDIATVNILIHQ
jgi:ubiquitin-conjugating enzyme E2 J2